jgi:peptidoglycan/xylan/chitin deacetylase (PgdA/CDA1 family)
MVERSLVHCGAIAVARRRVSGRALILAYHNIIPDGLEACGDRSLHLPRSRFARQLDLLEHGHEVVPLDRILEPSGNGLPRVAITFDDAYQGALEHGIAELERRGMPATIFVSPQLLGQPSFWWDAVAGLDGSGLAARVRDYALDALRGDDGEVRKWALGRRGHDTGLPPEIGPATEDHLREAASRAGITLGAHGWSHRNLTRLHPAELEVELVRPLTWLRKSFATAVPWLAYPYGIHSAAVVEAARERGYIGAVGVRGGWIPRQPNDPLVLPRLNLPAGLSPEGFLLRISGVLGR